MKKVQKKEHKAQNIVDDAHGKEAFSKLFGEKIEELHNRVSFDISEMSDLRNKIDHGVSHHCVSINCNSNHYISLMDVECAVKKHGMKMT